MMEEFEKCLGYKINNSKSILMFLNEKDRKNATVKTNFTIGTDGFKYLGIQITPNLKEIVSTNNL